LIVADCMCYNPVVGIIRGDDIEGGCD
jgi:hypothetical protein